MHFEQRSLDKNVLPKHIYKTEPYQTTTQCLIIDTRLRNEFQQFLTQYFQFLGYTEKFQGFFTRTDIYLDIHLNTFWIIEVNTCFVDGWGIALNLEYALGNNGTLTEYFPRKWTLAENAYLPEFKLTHSELKRRGLETEMISMQEALHGNEECYWYGRFARKGFPHILPRNGYVLDDKQNLMNFSKIWNGTNINIPPITSAATTSWEELPESTVLKFTQKNCPEAIKARVSVLKKPNGKAKFMKKCYAQELLVAQQYQTPHIEEGFATQLILLSAGTSLITGYVQYVPAETLIINDNCIHGAVSIE